MNTRKFLLIAALALVPCLLCRAQDKGYWYAASSNAKTITGDIGFSEDTLKINLISFPLARIRTLAPAEVSAAFDADVNAGGTGVLYRVTVGAARRFLNKNTLCGTADTQWMATYVSGRTLRAAFFSGSDPPIFTLDAISKSTDLCGTFTYGR